MKRWTTLLTEGIDSHKRGKVELTPSPDPYTLTITAPGDKAVVQHVIPAVGKRSKKLYFRRFPASLKGNGSLTPSTTPRVRTLHAGSVPSAWSRCSPSYCSASTSEEMRSASLTVDVYVRYDHSIEKAADGPNCCHTVIRTMFTVSLSSRKVTEEYKQSASIVQDERVHEHGARMSHARTR